MIGLMLFKNYMMKYKEYNLFPTQVLKFDFSDSFTREETDLMVADINYICNEGNLIQDDDLTPKYQSLPILFLDIAPPFWQKLKLTFLDSCKNYLKIVDNFSKNQTSLQFTGTRAWFYKGWNSLNKTQSNPWHNHNPSFLSGVFYLSMPEDENKTGTEFLDPRQHFSHGSRTQMIEQMNLSWIIFPGWLYHKSVLSISETPRYIIAADSYVKVN